MAALNYRSLEPGMGEAVASRTILRTEGGTKENWGDVAHRVADGNVSLAENYDVGEYARLRDHIAQARLLMSGRHLQHGDSKQPERNMEVFTNCSTAMASFVKFYLLLNGSGVGRLYDDALMLVDWDYMPEIVPVLSAEHRDYPSATYGDGTPFMAAETANRVFGDNVHRFVVPDSREGWAEAVELVERMAYERASKWDYLVLDFSEVRPAGEPIGGMQDRPASGPVPLMRAFMEMHAVKGKDMEPWEQTMRVDHALAACVAVGGARRAARIALKNWSDPGIFRFIKLKQESGLWTANNSVIVDRYFWWELEKADREMAEQGVTTSREYAVFEAVLEAQYEHGTGEPGFINVDRLNQNEDGLENHRAYQFFDGYKYKVDHRTKRGFLTDTFKAVGRLPYKFIVNPCGEIVLFVGGGYCVIADVVPFFADDLDTARDAFITATRALIRTNTMGSLYDQEVKRTNRIGVGMTGIQEFAWKHFGLTFKDLISDFDKLMEVSDTLDDLGWSNEYSDLMREDAPALSFWVWLRDTRKAVEEEADRYSDELGMVRPHTVTTIKPAGTTSKLFILSEGAHLPAREEFLRWVQFQHDDPIVAEYEALGYPVDRNIKNAQGEHVADAIVGFPTQPQICRLGIPRDRLTTAGEATMDEQFKWVRLLEKFWLGPRGNQISYTLKYDRDEVDAEQYRNLILKHMPHVRAVSVMPASDWRETQRLYGYVPEQPVSKEAYDHVVERIREQAEETIALEDIACESGACPI